MWFSAEAWVIKPDDLIKSIKSVFGYDTLALFDYVRPGGSIYGVLSRGALLLAQRAKRKK